MIGFHDPTKKKYTIGFDLSYWDLFVKFSEKHKKHGDKFSIINKQIYPNIRITLYLIQLLTPRTQALVLKLLFQMLMMLDEMNKIYLSRLGFNYSSLHYNKYVLAI